MLYFVPFERARRSVTDVTRPIFQTPKFGDAAIVVGHERRSALSLAGQSALTSHGRWPTRIVTVGSVQLGPLRRLRDRRFGGSWGFDLGAVHQSVTVWQGEQDILLPMDHARRLATALTSSTLNVVAASGHYLPAVIADVVLDDLVPR